MRWAAKIGAAQDQVAVRHAAGQKALGQRRPLIGQVGLVGDDADRRLVAGFARADGRLDAGIGCANDQQAAHSGCPGVQKLEMERVRGTADSLRCGVYRTSVRRVQANAAGSLAQHRGNRCHNNPLAWNSSRYKIAHKFNRRTNMFGRWRRIPRDIVQFEGPHHDEPRAK
ncbi:hypothetical protein ONR75_09160 [Rhodopseudomonas sp. P2A-2r]|nr:hypothetical protein [Rhodopseudomonas sp. P2A-2r]UZE50784.1 hypothetical protein ONR75_09160 [Rhodopseudomonas sp. P2A-2r]